MMFAELSLIACATCTTPLAYSQPSAVGPQLSPGADAPSFLDDGYWIVSSRRAAQHRRDYCRAGLDVFHSPGDGCLFTTEFGALGASLTPGVPVCVMVHGSFVEWDKACRDARSTYRWLSAAAQGRPFHFVYFTWPSDGNSTGLIGIDVSIRGQRAEFNGLHLAHVVSTVPEASPVCLIGHSHGARAALSMLHLAAGGVVQDLVFVGNVGARPFRAVLAAAALDHDWMNPGKRYDRALCVSEVLILRNCQDLALSLYPLAQPFTRPALSTTGLTWGDRERLGVLAFRAPEMDIAPIVGRHHEWPHYLEAPGLAGAIAPFALFWDRYPETAQPAPMILESVTVHAGLSSDLDATN